MQELIWEITNECLNNCRHCSSNLTDAEGLHKFNVQDIKNGVKIFNDHGFKHVILSGGEPGLHTEFDEIIDSIMSVGSEVSMYSSGVYPDGFFTKNRLRSIQKLRTVYLSINSHDPLVHDFFTGNPKSFENTLKSLDCFVKVGVNVEVNIVPVRQNQHDLAETVDFILNRGASRVNFLKLVRQGSAEINWMAIQPDYEKLNHKFNCLQLETNIRIGTPFGQKRSKGQFCGAGHKKICITYDGYILPCEVFKQDRKKFPNFYRPELLIEDVITSFRSLASIADDHQLPCYKTLIQKSLSI